MSMQVGWDCIEHQYLLEPDLLILTTFNKSFSDP